MSLDLDGTRLRTLREMRVMERRELAEKSGISYSTLSQLETNCRRARAQTARRLADALGVPPEELVRRLRVAGRPREVS